jgi:XTP/dITP diphosphohydrolase
MELLVATRSAGKMREIRRILAEVPRLRVLSPGEMGIEYDPAEEDLEPHDSFEANAFAKARYFMGESGVATVADDSGLRVDALGGAPGVRSKRFAPEEGLDGRARDDANNAYLLERLREVGPAARTARYVCVAAFVGPEHDPVVLEGEAAGLVLEEPRGSGGFGYDPYIFDPNVGKTFAEMTGEEKNQRSHRGMAFRQLADLLRNRLG